METIPPHKSGAAPHCRLLGRSLAALIATTIVSMVAVVTIHWSGSGPVALPTLAPIPIAAATDQPPTQQVSEMTEAPRIWLPARREIVDDDMRDEFLADIQTSLAASREQLGVELASLHRFRSHPEFLVQNSVPSGH